MKTSVLLRIGCLGGLSGRAAYFGEGFSQGFAEFTRDFHPTARGTRCPKGCWWPRGPLLRRRGHQHRPGAGRALDEAEETCDERIASGTIRRLAAHFRL